MFIIEERLEDLGVKAVVVDIALLHKSDISQLSSESFNQMIDMFLSYS